MPETIKDSLSEKLLKYIEKVEHETKRQVKLEYLDSNEFGLPGNSFAHKVDSIFVYVGIASGTKIDDLRSEKSIAREITHGLLI
jgi:hypothetical protein